MSYTKEPWRANKLATGDGVNPYTVKIYAGKLLVAETPFLENRKTDPFFNAWRIASCVNACAGMAKPIADIAALKEAVEVHGLQLDQMEDALLWVLYHHQGGSSHIGQPIRKLLGIGQHDHMTPDQIERGKAFAKWGAA